MRLVRRKVNVCCTLNRLQRNIQFCIAANNAATVADIDTQVTFKHAVWQRPTVVGTEPESQEMASTFDLGPILETGACVQYLMIVKELNVTRLERHIKAEFQIL